MGIKALFYKKLTASEIAAGTMPTSGFQAVDVYQDTCTFIESDGSSTVHKSETSSKKIAIKTKGDKQLVFSIMDPSKALRAEFEGGTYTAGTQSASATYVEPESYSPVKMAFIVLPDDGDALHIVRADVMAKNNTTYSKTGISLLEVTADPELPIMYTEDQTIPGQSASA